MLFILLITHILCSQVFSQEIQEDTTKERPSVALVLGGGGAKGFDGYISTHYKSASDTNFTKIFNTESEMRGIQALIDEYVDKYK